MKNLVIAEVGSVHDGSYGNAEKLIDLVAEVGAQAIKFQTHISEEEGLKDAPPPHYFTSEARNAYFDRTGFSGEQWGQLKVRADQRGIEFLSSPFSMAAVDLLESIDMGIYKIPSGEVTNLPLLEKIADLGKPVLLSSGMSSWSELDLAVEIFRNRCDLTVLQCTSVYPCPAEQVGLNVMTEMAKRYKCAVGLSDHTLGPAAAIAAVALGATVIEKHFTFSRYMYGSDACHSTEPEDFRLLIDALGKTWVMAANPVDKNDMAPHAAMKEIFEKSIVAASDLAVGTVLKVEHLAFKKPGTGISAARYRELIGVQLHKSIACDQMFEEMHLK